MFTWLYTIHSINANTLRLILTCHTFNMDWMICKVFASHAKSQLKYRFRWWAIILVQKRRVSPSWSNFLCKQILFIHKYTFWWYAIHSSTVKANGISFNWVRCFAFTFASNRNGCFNLDSKHFQKSYEIALKSHTTDDYRGFKPNVNLSRLL